MGDILGFFRRLFGLRKPEEAREEVTKERVEEEREETPEEKEKVEEKRERAPEKEEAPEKRKEEMKETRRCDLSGWSLNGSLREGVRSSVWPTLFENVRRKPFGQGSGCR
jgi:hypothetical protein